MTIKMTAMASVIFGAASIGAQARDQGAVPVALEPPAAGSSTSLDMAAIKSAVPSLADLVKGTALTVYSIPANAASGETGNRLVLEDGITGRACVQVEPGAVKEVKTFQCFNAEEIVPDITRSEAVNDDAPAKTVRSGQSDERIKIQTVTLEQGTLGSYYELQVSYVWNNTKGVCATLIQNSPDASVTEIGCAGISGKDYLKHFKVNGREYGI